MKRTSRNTKRTSRIPAKYIERARKMDWAPGITVEQGALYLMQNDEEMALLKAAYSGYGKKKVSRNPVTARHLKHLEKMFRDHRAGKIDDARLQAEVWLAQTSGATREQVQQIRERLNYYPRYGASRFTSNPVAKRTSRNPGIDTKLYSVVDRMTGFERRHLTKEQARQTLEAHAEQCSRYGWRHEARVYYRDGTDVTREFLGGSMDRNPRLTESQRAKLPLSVFVFPERRAFPLESEAAAYDAIRMLRLGRVKSASDFKAVTDAIRREYPAVWKKYGAGLSWPKTKAAKALGSKRRAATVAKKRTSRMAANGELQWWGVWTGKHHQMNVLASSEADAIARFERKTLGTVFVPGGEVTARLLDDQSPRGRSAPMPLPHWKPRRNPEAHGATFPGTLAGYHAAHGWLLQHGFYPVPGSSRYEDNMRRTGRIVDAGRDYRVEVEKKLGRNPEAKLDKQDRAMINESLIRAGLDGNGRFRSVGMALSAASGVLDDYGLEPDEVLSAWKFSGPSGHTQIHVAQSNRSDPFSPTPIGNSALAFSWHQHGEGRWEALAYMS